MNKKKAAKMNKKNQTKVRLIFTTEIDFNIDY